MFLHKYLCLQFATVIRSQDSPLYMYSHLHCSFSPLHLLQLNPHSLHHPSFFLSYILIRSHCVCVCLCVCVCVCAYEPGPAVVNEVNMVARQTSPPPSFFFSSSASSISSCSPFSGLVSVVGGKRRAEQQCQHPRMNSPVD